MIAKPENKLRLDFSDVKGRVYSLVFELAKNVDVRTRAQGEMPYLPGSRMKTETPMEPKPKGTRSRPKPKRR